MAQYNHFNVIPKRPEIRLQPAAAQAPVVTGFRNPDTQLGYYTPSFPRSPEVISRYPSVAPSSPRGAPVLNQYPPTAAPFSAGQSKVGTQRPPLSPSAFYREDPAGRNFLTLPTQRTSSRTPLTIPSSNHHSVPNSPAPTVKPTPAYYRTYSHSPFETGRRSTPILDKYPSVLTLNEVKVSPVPGERPGRFSTSAIPSVLERYPPAAEEGVAYYHQNPNRNSAPVYGAISAPQSPSTVSKKKNKSPPAPTVVDDNFVPNRFRYPASPVGTLRRIPPIPSPLMGHVSRVPQLTLPPSPRMGYNSVPLQPPPPLPPIQPTQIRIDPPPPPKRIPSNASVLVRKPSLKIKRSGSKTAVAQQPPPAPRRRAPPPNHLSRLLSEAENSLAFQILGHERQTLSTAVVQFLLPANGYDDGNGWSLEGVTVLCFVRDAGKKSYFLEFLSLNEQCCIFACEIYEEFGYKSRPNSRFITFEAEDTYVGVNFADYDEFLEFTGTLDKKIDSKRQRRHERQSKILEASAASSKENGYFNADSVQPQQVVVKEPKKNRFTFGRRTSKGKKDTKKRVAKRDIGTPSNFTHVSHAGFDPQHGFQTYGDIDLSNYQEVFQKAKISQRELNDPDTRKFIYQFVENYEKESGYELPTPSPPPPPRAIPQAEPEPDYNQPQRHDRGRVPPPPPRSPKTVPPPAPPMRMESSGRIPPPPPMPTEAELNEPIKKTFESEPADCNGLPQIKTPEADCDVRSNLLREIQAGAKGKLKPVDGTLRVKNDSARSGMAGALQRALAERSRAINPDSSSSDSDEEAFDSEEWEDD